MKHDRVYIIAKQSENLNLENLTDYSVIFLFLPPTTKSCFWHLKFPVYQSEACWSKVEYGV